MRFVFVVVAMAIVAAVVVQNNSDFFKHRFDVRPSPTAVFSPRDEQGVVSALVAAAAMVDTVSADTAVPVMAQESIESAVAVEPVAKQVAVAPPSVEQKVTQPDNQTIMKVRQSLEIGQISCALRDRSDLKLFISIELFFESDTLRPLLMVRREDIKIMVQKVIARKQLNDIVVENVRRDIVVIVNQMLKHPYISDVEFRDFRIEKATSL